jgi:hypothetical protein
MSGDNFIELALFGIAGPVSCVDSHAGRDVCNLPCKPVPNACSNIGEAPSGSPEEERLCNRLCRDFADYPLCALTTSVGEKSLADRKFAASHVEVRPGCSLPRIFDNET